MNSESLIPSSPRNAVTRIRKVFEKPAGSLERIEFLKAWFAVAYIFPGLHPDDYDSPGSGWPKILQPLADEAWQRAERGEIHDDELYPSDAQWAGTFDRLNAVSERETAHRKMIDLNNRILG